VARENWTKLSLLADSVRPMTRLSAFSFALLTGALASLFTLALAFGGQDNALDRALLAAMQFPALVPAARLVTRLGDWWAYLPLGGAAAAWLLWRGRTRHALLLAALLLSERLLVTLLKLLFARARPDPAGHLDFTYTLSFPSGHATNAMTLGLGAALLLAPGKGRGLPLALGLLFAFLVGATRPLLGVHWPSDVLGGWALGALWTLLLLRLAAGTSSTHPH
jgi:undecaprenyl-diphosphatase